MTCTDQQSADVLVAVGWHTPAERALRAARTGQRRVLWSHGLATLILYRIRPVLGGLRLLSRCPQLLAVIATLRRCDRLVVAYQRRSRWDPRSFDVVMARWLQVPVAVVGRTTVIIPGLQRAAHGFGCLDWSPGMAEGAWPGAFDRV
ncbi:MAG: hypothetical protein EBZ51_09040 [Synechococcaceae bacterium WB9_2_112]|nr:hypothetical protein [Synechococcaceae bacterium WB9_2_112]